MLISINCTVPMMTLLRFSFFCAMRSSLDESAHTRRGVMYVCSAVTPRSSIICARSKRICLDDALLPVHPHGANARQSTVCVSSMPLQQVIPLQWSEDHNVRYHLMYIVEVQRERETFDIGFAGFLTTKPGTFGGWRQGRDIHKRKVCKWKSG